MARSFNGSSDYINVVGGHVTPNITISCWLRFNSIAASQLICGEWDNPGNTWLLYFWKNGGTDDRFALHAGGIDAYIDVTGSVSTGVWYHLCVINVDGVVTHMTLQALGAALTVHPVTNGGRTWTSGSDDFQWGKWGANSFNGQLAECAIYSGGLDGDSVNALSRGFSPLLVSPVNLASYWPFIGRYNPEPDLAGGFHGTLSGTAAVDHLHVLYPTGLRIGRRTALPSVVYRLPPLNVLRPHIFRPGHIR